MEHDETCGLERNDDAAEMLGAAGRFAGGSPDAHDDRYAGVGMLMSEDDSVHCIEL
jgi:hypothetical protein